MLAFDEAGQLGGRPLVLVHGWCCHRGHMAGLRAHFSATHHVFAVDLPGHGQTALGSSPPHLDSFAASVCSFLIKRGLHQVVLIGHSMGGTVSILAAGQEPDLIAGVVNLDGPVPLTAPAHAVYHKLFDRLDAEGFQSVIGRFIREVFFLPSERGCVSEAIVAEMLSCPEALALALMRQVPRFDAESALRASRAPLLFIGSSHPRFDESGLSRLRPDAWVARVALSGHFVQVFALPQVTAMIERFLALEVNAASATSSG